MQNEKTTSKDTSRESRLREWRAKRNKTRDIPTLVPDLPLEDTPEPAPKAPTTPPADTLADAKIEEIPKIEPAAPLEEAVVAIQSGPVVIAPPAQQKEAPEKKPPPPPEPDPAPAPKAVNAPSGIDTPAPPQRTDPIEEQRQKLRLHLAIARRKFWLGLTVSAIIPALLAVAYETYVAVPIYEAQSVALVSKASSVGNTQSNSLLGAIGAGSGINLTEAFMAQEYVQSQALLEYLESETGVVTRLSGDDVDPFRRLHTMEFLGISKQSQFTRFVKSSVNLQTGMLTLHVRALSPEEAVQLSELISAKLESRVNALSTTLYDEQVEQSRVAVQDARQYLLDTQNALASLQIESGEADLQIRVVGIYDSIAKIEVEILGIETQIAQQNVAGLTDSFQTDRLTALKTNLEERIALMRERLLETPAGSAERPLNELLLEYQRLQLEREIGLEVLSLALVAQEQAQESATLGRSQFQVVVPPLVEEIPWRPRPLYAGLVVFLFGISLASMIRLFRR